MYGINTYLNSYAEALKWWEETKPIRGRKEDVRPIGWRGYTHHLIRKTDKGAIECVMNERPIVTFHKNGNIDIHNYVYNTVTTTYFIRSVLGNWVSAYIFDHSLVLGVRGRNEQRRVAPEGKLTIATNGKGGNYHFLRDEVQYTHVINRTKTNNVRERFKDFIDYAIGMAKLRGDEVYGRDEIDKALGKYQGFDLTRIRYTYHKADAVNAVTTFKKLLTSKGDTKYDNYYKILMWIAYSYGGYDWLSRGKVLNLGQCKNGLNEMLFGIFRDECFDAKPTEHNNVKRDPYGKFYAGAWAVYHGDR